MHYEQVYCIKPIPPNLAGRAENSRTLRPACEVGYQFGSDYVFQWLHQVTDVWNGSAWPGMSVNLLEVSKISISLYPCVALYEVSSDHGGLSRPVALVYLVGKIICCRSCLQPFLNIRKPSHTIRHMLALWNGRDFKMDSNSVFHGRPWTTRSINTIWRNGPYIGGHHAFIFKLNFKHIYNLL